MPFLIPDGARELTLPLDDRTRLLTVTAARNPNDAVLSAPRRLIAREGSDGGRA